MNSDNVFQNKVKNTFSGFSILKYKNTSRYFAAYELDPTFNINNNKPYTQFILPVQDTYLNCLVVPKNHIMYNTGPYSTQYERNSKLCF